MRLDFVIGNSPYQEERRQQSISETRSATKRKSRENFHGIAFLGYAFHLFHIVYEFSNRPNV